MQIMCETWKMIKLNDINSREIKPDLHDTSILLWIASK